MTSGGRACILMSIRVPAAAQRAVERGWFSAATQTASTGFDSGVRNCEACVLAGLRHLRLKPAEVVLEVGFLMGTGLLLLLQVCCRGVTAVLAQCASSWAPACCCCCSRREQHNGRPSAPSLSFPLS